MRRAMHVLSGQGPQEESTFYDHPYFGQLFLAGVLEIIDYPHSLNPSSTTSHNDIQPSIEMLYLIPRVLMGILAVIDTILVYKISQYCYNRHVALIASILFAVMPSTWLIRWILLDSIQLTLVLSSILLALYTTDSKKRDIKKNRTKILLILFSGIFLGLAIFTKIPAFTMIPIVGFLVYTRTTNKDSKIFLGLWFIPVILIPLIWPAYSISVGQFKFWLDGILWQIHREGQPLFNSIYIFFKNDPILLILGITGLVFAIIKKDILLSLWAIPFMIFLYLIEFVSIYHLIPLLPVFCIAAATLIGDLSKEISRKKVQQILLPFIIISGIGLFGLVSTIMLITTNVNSAYFKADAFIAHYLQNDNQKNTYNNHDKVTVISDAFYLWIPQYIFRLDENYKMYFDNTPVKTKKVLLIVDRGLINAMSRNDEAAKQIQKIYNSHNTSIVATFQEGEQHKDYKVSIYQYNSK
jgi:hypothetical protein